VYNVVKMSFILKAPIKVYSLDGSENSGEGNNVRHGSSIILVNSIRDEVDQEISISLPPCDCDDYDKSKFQTALIESNVVDWDKPCKFKFIDRSVSSTIVEVSAHVKGNLTHINPCYAYVIKNPEEYTMNDSIDSSRHKDLEREVLKEIDLEEGLEFIYKNWKYSDDGTRVYLRRILRNIPSAGLYLEGNIVSGAVQASNGVMSMLHTQSEHRNKGYGVKVMRHLIKELLKAGLSPCSVAEIKNLASQKLHEKIGMVKSHDVDYIWCNNK